MSMVPHMSMVPLRYGDKREAVRRLQVALDKRSTYYRRAYGGGFPSVKIDGKLGPDTATAVQRVGRALGAMESTLKTTRDTGVVSVGLQRMIRWPALRNPAQLGRARDRKEATATKATAGPAVALKWIAQYVGKTEQPPGSNRAPWGLTDWQLALGAWLVGQAWCGTIVGTALIRAGVKGVNSRVASVWFILEDGLAGRNGMRRVIYRRKTGTGSVRDGQPGDLLGIGGEGTHVAMAVERVPGGYRTREGNTSPGTSGSQSNGGGVWERFRPDSSIVYIVRPDWESAT